MNSQRRMPLVDALRVVADYRADRIVVTTMGAAREWRRFEPHRLDFHYLPSAMGHGPMLGLGLALAQPQREVVVLNGDGCMLMGLGCLVTVVAQQVANYTLIVVDNGIYEVTGGQRTAAAGEVDFATLAAAAGFRQVAWFDDLPTWQTHAAEVLSAPGPRFIQLRVAPVGADYHLPTPEPMAQQIERFRLALAS